MDAGPLAVMVHALAQAIGHNVVEVATPASHWTVVAKSALHSQLAAARASESVSVRESRAADPLSSVDSREAGTLHATPARRQLIATADWLNHAELAFEVQWEAGVGATDSSSPFYYHLPSISPSCRRLPAPSPPASASASPGVNSPGVGSLATPSRQRGSWRQRYEDVSPTPSTWGQSASGGSRSGGGRVGVRKGVHHGHSFSAGTRAFVEASTGRSPTPTSRVGAMQLWCGITVTTQL